MPKMLYRHRYELDLNGRLLRQFYALGIRAVNRADLAIVPRTPVTYF